MKARKLTLILALLLVFWIAASEAFAASQLVVTKTQDTNDGICNNDCSLREAVSSAKSGDSITFSPYFHSPQTIVLTNGQMIIDTSVTLTGPGAGLLSISGNNAGRIFYISGGSTVSMSGIRIRNGRVGGNSTSDAVGGAVYVVNSTFNLANVEMSNNVAFNSPSAFGRGGAVYTFGECSITLENVHLHDNTAPQGAAVYAYPSLLSITDSTINNNTGGALTAETLNIQNTVISGNTNFAINAQHISLLDSAVTGNLHGAIYGGDAAGTIIIERSIISDNRNSSSGGGVVNAGLATIRDTVIKNNMGSPWGGGIANTGDMYIYCSSITNNTSAQGGGIFTGVGKLFLTNSTVSGNAALGTITSSRGGGIYNATTGSPGSRITLINSTIASNRSSGMGGGLRQDATGIITVRNTIIAQNISLLTNEADVSGPVISEGVNLVGNTTGSSGWLTVDILNQNPLLAPFGNNGRSTLTHALLPGSPAINAGNNALAVDPQTMFPLIYDQRGFGRFVGPVDIGAYEAFYSVSAVTISGKVLKSTGRGISGARVTLTDPNGTVRYSQTNPAGYYRFMNLTTGITYTIAVIHKSYLFDSPLFFTADQNREDFNFLALL